MESLRHALSSNPTPWHLDWKRLIRIDSEAMPLLAGLFASLCSEPVDLRFSGADHLVQGFRAALPSGDRSVPAAWWTVRLNALRVMQLEDEFELAALDYCVTYEVAPVAWQPARCQYRNSQGAVAVKPADGYAANAPVVLELRGQVVGDASQALSAMDQPGRRGLHIVVLCDGLERVDFPAAGSILNWAASRQAEGCLVQFRHAHRLVAAFFMVIGINEHASIVLRPV
jgi:hypothetical protein